MLLAATLVALVLGLATSAWRTKRFAQIMHLEFSPSGKYLAAKYSGGSIQVWDVSTERPKLIQHVPVQRLFGADVGQIRFADDATLIDLQNEWDDSGFETVFRSLDVRSGRVTSSQPIPYAAYMPSFAVFGKVLAIPNAGTGSIELYDLPAGKFTRAITVPSNPWYVEFSADGKLLAVVDQNGGLSLIEVASETTLANKTGGRMYTIVDLRAGRLVAGSAYTSGPDSIVEVFELPSTEAARSLNTGLQDVIWLRLSADGLRLAVSDGFTLAYYDIASGKLLARIALTRNEDADRGVLPSFTDVVNGENLALSPDGNTLASFSGGQITLRDLPSGQVRQRIAGGWRGLQIVIFTLGFIAWSAAWGIVARRERLRQSAVEPVPNLPIWRLQAERPPSPAPSSRSQLLTSSVCILAAVLVAAVLLSLEWSWSIPETIGYAILLVVGIVVAMIVLAVAYTWLMSQIMGPNYLTLARLRQIAHDPGRQAVDGKLTAVFFGPSNIEAHYASRAAEVRARASELFGQPIDFTGPSLVACLDRQGDLDAFMMRHVPIAAVVPNVWTRRLAVVCEETALRRLIEPADALAAALALLLSIQYKRGLLPGWASLLCVQQIAKGDRYESGLRAAIRRLKVLAVRRPDWDPRQVFSRSVQQRADLWLAGDQPEAWREVHAEVDFLATLGEMLLGADASQDQRSKVLTWLRTLQPKDDPLATFGRQVGWSLDELLARWQAWMATQSGLPFDPLPETKAAAVGALHAPALWDRSRPQAERARAARQIGGSGYVAFVPLLVDELEYPQCDIRFDVIEALENLSGQTFGDNPPAWDAWFDSLPSDVRDWPQVTCTRAARDAPLEAIVLDTPAAATIPPTPAAALPRAAGTPPDRPPAELKLCWGLMFLGGCAALAVPISLMFLWGPLFFPTIYFGLFAGVRAVASGAARETLGLKNVAGLQTANLIACDPINLLLGSMELHILSRPHVQHHLLQANGGRL